MDDSTRAILQRFVDTDLKTVGYLGMTKLTDLQTAVASLLVEPSPAFAGLFREQAPEDYDRIRCEDVDGKPLLSEYVKEQTRASEKTYGEARAEGFEYSPISVPSYLQMNDCSYVLAELKPSLWESLSDSTAFAFVVVSLIVAAVVSAILLSPSYRETKATPQPTELRGQQ